MVLTLDAAIEVVRAAGDRGLTTGRVEGGIWDGACFEARLDCIWDVPDELDSTSAARSAEEFIKSESDEHNAYIVSLIRN